MKANPLIYNAWLYRGHAYEVSGQLDKAAADYLAAVKAAAKIDPTLGKNLEKDVADHIKKMRAPK